MANPSSIARTIADLYKKRWDIELFFKAIKQNLQIKTLVGTCENAVKSQISVALITCLLLQLIERTIAKKIECLLDLRGENQDVPVLLPKPRLRLQLRGRRRKEACGQAKVDFNVGKDFLSPLDFSA